MSQLVNDVVSKGLSIDYVRVYGGMGRGKNLTHHTKIFKISDKKSYLGSEIVNFFIVINGQLLSMLRRELTSERVRKS